MKTYLITSEINKESCFDNIVSVTDGIVFQEYNISKFTSSNVADNDLFIADLINLKGKTIEDVNSIKNHITDRIHAGGVLVCFAGEYATYHSKGSNYSWIDGVEYQFESESLHGKDFEFSGSQSFIEVFSAIKDQFSYNQIFNILRPGFYSIIALSKAHKAVGLHAQLNKGHIFILPRPKNKEEFLKYFINKIMPLLGVDFPLIDGSTEPKPDFLHAILLSTQDELKAKIEEQKSLIIVEEKKLLELNKKNEELEDWKMLLWQTGEPLELIVKAFFKMLGLNLKKQETDLVGEYEEKEVFIEVKGKMGGIDHAHDFRQILDRKLYTAKNPQNTFALLVGNPYRLQPISKRPPSSDHTLFAKTSLIPAKDLKIGLISTLELFDIVNDILSNEKIDKEKILRGILSSCGVYKYKK